MLDHFGFNVRDLERSVAFYEACLAPLGLAITERHPYGAVIIARPGDEAPFFWMGTARPSFWAEDHQAGASPMHLCFIAPSRSAVDAFHAAALAHGGRDNGAPGERGPGYYAAYVLDPDGNNVEASVRDPAATSGSGD
jgi:catechol 2,3-dioxygenase-like lactoylglutathione lyase family enzyme